MERTSILSISTVIGNYLNGHHKKNKHESTVEWDHGVCRIRAIIRQINTKENNTSVVVWDYFVFKVIDTEQK